MELPSSFQSLPNHTQQSLVDYLKFLHHQVQLSKKSLSASLDEFQNQELPFLSDRAIQYTNDEITDSLAHIREKYLEEFEKESKSIQYLQLELLRQLLVEAETQNVKLKLNLSKVEDEELISKVQHLDKTLHEPKNKKLTPLGRSSMDVAQEIEMLKTQNSNIRKKLKKTQEELQTSKNENEELKRKFQGDIDSIHGDAQKSVSQLQEELKESKLQVRNMQKELSQKVQQTQQFQNIQQMLRSKNEQLKELRERLSKYETVE